MLNCVSQSLSAEMYYFQQTAYKLFLEYITIHTGFMRRYYLTTPPGTICETWPLWSHFER